jgi:hypothetical protein
MTQAGTTDLPQIVFALGVAGYLSYRDRDRMEVGSRMSCRSAFNRLLQAAKQRGFHERRQLVGAVRRGRPTAFAMERVRTMCALLPEGEIERELRALERWERLAGRL